MKDIKLWHIYIYRRGTKKMLHLTYGCMFSGKSKQLIEDARKYDGAKKLVLNTRLRATNRSCGRATVSPHRARRSMI